MTNLTHYCPVTVIIPNFNGVNLLQKNLPSVIEAVQEYPGECALIVVDDASRDASVEMVRSIFPMVEVITHKKNKGFAEAIHSGVNAASTEWLIFLNSDVRPASGFIAPLVQHLVQPDVFSVSPWIIDEKNRPTGESWRNYYVKHCRLRTVSCPAYPPSKAVETLFVSGGSIALCKSKFLSLDGFLPLFKPFYSEDSDLGIRAWRRGWRSVLEPTSCVVHEHRGSSINSNVSARYVRRIRRRNQFLLEWLHVPMNTFIKMLIVGYAWQALGRLFTLNMTYFMGFFSALYVLPEVIKSRRSVAQTSVMGFWEITASVQKSTSDWK